MTTFRVTDSYFWQGSLIRLRPVRHDDWEAWYQDSTDSEGIRLLEWGIELPVSPEQAKRFADQYSDFKDQDRIMFSIETLSEELAGGININSIDNRNGTFSIGIRIYRPYRGRSFGTEAMKLALRYGFHELRLQKCNSGCVITNTASIKMHEKAGFIQEGIRRRMNFTNGQYFDNILWGITREEFDAHNSYT